VCGPRASAGPTLGDVSALDLDLLDGVDALAGAARGQGRSRRRYVLVDVFTRKPLHGNALAVFTDARGLSGETMQRVARELNLSETAFLLPAAGAADAQLRIFTPAQELAFAGHPVLGCAAVIAGALERDSVVLQTGAGDIAVEMHGAEGERVVRGEMRQPVPSCRPFERPRELLAALGVARSGLPLERYENGPVHVFVELDGDEAVASLAPDMRALAGLRGLAVSCFAGDGQRYKTRVFAPGAGVAEDPATGSAAGPLAVHLCRHGRVAFGRRIEIRQGDEIGRPSILYARADGDGAWVQSVQVGGSAVIVGAGELAIG
jgi:trans-2,3-dihydro-3-hydroxyanthranilate isomerase